MWVYFAAWQRQWGTAAEYTVLPAERAVPLGDACFALGATLGIPALTAHRCLFADGALTGATVLVAGGAGAVGHAAIELARWGARGPDHHHGLERGEGGAGAGRGGPCVVNYREADAAARSAGSRPTASTGSSRSRSRRTSSWTSPVGARHVVTYAGSPGRRRRGAGAPADGGQRRAALRARLHDAAQRVGRAVADVAEAVAAGALTTLPLHRFPLDRAPEAHDAVEGGAVGKVLIDI